MYLLDAQQDASLSVFDPEYGKSACWFILGLSLTAI